MERLLQECETDKMRVHGDPPGETQLFTAQDLLLDKGGDDRFQTMEKPLPFLVGGKKNPKETHILSLSPSGQQQMMTANICQSRHAFTY